MYASAVLVVFVGLVIPLTLAAYMEAERVRDGRWLRPSPLVSLTPFCALYIAIQGLPPESKRSGWFDLIEVDGQVNHWELVGG